MLQSDKIRRKTARYTNPELFGFRMRKKRIAPLLSMIENVCQRKKTVKIVDIGGTKKYWDILPKSFLEKTKITIVNLPGALLPDNESTFSFCEGDGCDLNMFGDNTFDIVHSNSVIEHVGDWGKIVDFSKEVSRLGRQYFVQTPSYWFPIEPHYRTPFIHWLPVPIQARLILNYNLGNFRKRNSFDQAMRLIESIHLLSKPMIQELFPDAQIHTEWMFFPKSYVAIRK